MVIAPTVVGCAAIGAALTNSKRYHQVIGVFMFLMFIAFQLGDTLVIEFAS